MKSLYKDPSLSRKSSLLNRRGFFSRVGDGLHGAALVYLLSNDLFSMDLVQSGGSGKIADLKSRKPHLEPKAKSIIQLFMNGGPSQVDLLDPKPALEKYAGQSPSRDLISEIRAVREAGGLMPSPFKFSKHGANPFSKNFFQFFGTERFGSESILPIIKPDSSKVSL